MSIAPEGIPHTLLHHFKHNEALHEKVLILSILSSEIPLVSPEERAHIEDLGQGFYRVRLLYGFMEQPDMAESLAKIQIQGLPLDLYSTSFYLGRETLSATGAGTMAQWRKKLFILMSRNAWNATSFFNLPPDRVMELGSQVKL